MKIIQQTYKINAPVAKVFAALTDPDLIKQWSGSSAKMSSNAGEKFELWDKSITGENIFVKKNRKLVQTWFADNQAWKSYIKQGGISIAIFTLEESEGFTLLELTHEGVPEADYKETESGWKDYYLGPLKELLENTKSV